MKRSPAYHAVATALLTIGALGMLSACSRDAGFGGNAEASEVLGSSELRIESVSTRPYLVTGGDVLLRISTGEDLDVSRVQVAANGEDVTEQFRPAGRGVGAGPLVAATRPPLAGSPVHESENRSHGPDGGTNPLHRRLIYGRRGRPVVYQCTLTVAPGL